MQLLRDKFVIQAGSIMEKDVFGKALLEYQNGISTEDITTYLLLPGFNRPLKDTFPLAYLFRSFNEMPELEKKALGLCWGKVLDVGCGAGSHSLVLQEQGIDVTALDSSGGAIQTCRRRGLRKVVHSDIMDYHGTKFDTLLLLMNGLGMAGCLQDLDRFLYRLKSLLNAKGQVLLDSSDIKYMYHNDEDSTFHIPGGAPYYGEGRFVMEYQGEKSREFPWLYLDYARLEEAAAGRGMKSELVSQGDHYDYLARLSLEEY